MVDRRELSLGIIFTANIAQFNAAMTQLRGTMVNMAGGMDKVDKSAKKAGKGMKGAGQEFKQVGKQLSKVEGGVQRLLAAFKVVAAYGIAGSLMFGIINSIREGITTIFEFDQALFNLQAITNATEAEINAMGQAIFSVAEDTKFSAKEVGDAMVLLAQAGFTAAESMDAIQSVAMLATGTLTDLKTSSDLLTTVIRAFQLEASDAGRVADVMANAINRSKLTVDKLRVAFNYIGPVANKVGLSIEDTAAATMMLANAGIRASTIGTGLRQVLARLKAPNERLRESFIAAGADLSKFTGDSASMRDIIEELVKIVPDATRAFQLFGLRGAPAVSALTEAGVEGFDAMYEAVLKSGEATRMAETQMMGLVVMAKNLADRFGTLAIRIGEAGIAGAFEVFYIVARKVVLVLTELAEHPIAQVIIGTAALSIALLALAATFRFVTFATGSLVAGLGAVIAGQQVTIAMTKVLVANVGALRFALWTLNTAMIKWPWFFFVAGILAIVSAMKIWQRHQKRQLLNAETEEKQFLNNVRTLEKYQKRLEELIPGTVEYGSELERMVQQFPQLEDSIDRVTKSLTDNGVALENLKKAEADKAVARLVFQWDEYTKTMSRLKKEVEAGEPIWGAEFAGAPQEAVDRSKDLAEVSGKLQGIVQRVGEAFWKAGYRARTAWDPLVAMFKEMRPHAAERDVVAFVSAIIGALKSIEYRFLQVMKVGRSAIDDLPDYWKAAFDKMNAVEQLALLESVRTMNTRIAASEKLSVEMQLDEKRTAAAIAVIRLRTFQDFVKNTIGEVATVKEAREELIRLEKGFQKFQKELYDKTIENIDEGEKDKINLIRASGATRADEEGKIAAVSKKATDARAIALARLMGFEAAYLAVLKKRSDVDAKSLRDTEALLELRRTRLDESLMVDKEAKIEAKYEKRKAQINKLYEDEEKRAKRNVDLIAQAAADKNRRLAAADAERTAALTDLDLDRLDDALDIEKLESLIRLEEEKKRSISSMDLRSDLKKKELELEATSLRDRLARTKEAMGIEAEWTVDQRKELLRLELELQQNLYDQAELAHNIYLKGLERGSEAYIRNRQKVLRQAGEEELMVEREKWAIMKQYPKDWLKGLQAGLQLATIDFKIAARDWSTIVQNSAQHLSAAMEEYFFQVMKGNLREAHDAWKSFLDALLRELARFLAERATAEFLALMVRAMAAAGVGAGGGDGAPAPGSTTAGGALWMHRGGEVGVDAFPMRRFSKALIAAAPRLHSGLKPDEFPAVLQRGEQVIPRDEAGGGGDVTINIMTPDTRTMDEWVRRHRSLFAGATAMSIKEGDKQLVSSIKRVGRG